MRIRTTIGALLAGALLAGVAAAQTTVQGAVESIDEAYVQVAGQRRAMSASTALEDQGGHRLALSEVGVGTNVELELDDGGTVAVLRADVLR
jgi:hypothetical protein